MFTDLDTPRANVHNVPDLGNSDGASLTPDLTPTSVIKRVCGYPNDIESESVL